MYEDDMNDPWTGYHNPTVYNSKAEMDYVESGKWEEEQFGKPEPPEPMCWCCNNYEDGHCVKMWGDDFDPAYYVPDRDDKEPDDVCDDFDWNGEYDEMEDY